MNWTGGRLQRHSKNSASTVVNRQKQHFARIRTQLQNSTVSSAIPFQPSFIRAGNDTFCGDLPLVQHDEKRHFDRSRARRRHAGKSFAQSAARHDSGSSRQSPPGIIESHGASRRATIAHTAGEASGPAVMEMQSPSAHRSARSTIKKRQPRDAHARLTDSKPPNRATKHRRGSGEFDGERRRLLQRIDWVGLAPSRPLRMHFPSTHEKDKVGKRRRVATNLAARHDHEERARSIRMSPPQHRDRIHHHATGNHEEGIIVRIGVDAIASPSAEDDLDVPRHVQSSDSMLLDAEHGRNTEAHQRVSINSPCAAEQACNRYAKNDRSQNLRSTGSPVAGNGPYQHNSHAPEYSGETSEGPCSGTVSQHVRVTRETLPHGCLDFDMSSEPMAENHRYKGGELCIAQAVSDGFLHAGASMRVENPVSVSSQRESNASWESARISDSIIGKPLYAQLSEELNPPETEHQDGNGSMHYHAPGNIRPRGSESSGLAETDPSAKARMVNAIANRERVDTKELDGTSKATVAAVTEYCPQSSLWQIVDPCVKPTALPGGGADKSDRLWRRLVFSEGSSALSDAGREDEDGIIPPPEPIQVGEGRNDRLDYTNPSASAYSMMNASKWSVARPTGLGSQYKERAMIAMEHVVSATEKEEAADVTGSASKYNNACRVQAYLTQGDEMTQLSASQIRASEAASVRPLLSYENVTQLEMPGASTEHSREMMASLERPHRLTFSKPQVMMGTRSGTGNLRDGPDATSATTLKQNGKNRTRWEDGASVYDMAVSEDDEYDSDQN